MKKYMRRSMALLLALCCCLGCASIACAADSWAAVSMDANTLGLGFLIEPTMVNISEQPKASVAITDLLKENITGVEQPWKMTGNIESAFYLSQVYCPNQKDAKVADYILKVLDELGAQPNYESRNDDWLGEFDYYTMSGWMYSVDGSFPPVGAADYTLKNADVMRWQFTVYGYGSDLNADNSAWGSKSIVDSGNKDDLTWLVAYLNSRFDKSDLKKLDAYNDAMEALQNPEINQDSLNSVFDNLLVACELYRDITTASDSFAAINRLTAWHLLNGTGNGNFEPDTPMTKAMFLTVLYRMADSPAVTGNAAAGLSAWAQPAATWAVQTGLITSDEAASMTMSETATADECLRWTSGCVKALTETESDLASDLEQAETITRAQAAEILAEAHLAIKTAVKTAI